jgi:hypothetical protein
MRLSDLRSRARVFSIGVLFASVFLLSACELAWHEYDSDKSAGCSPYQVGCQPAIDVNNDGPILTTRYDVDRAQIVGAAERAPYRQCNEFSVGCQVQTIGVVLGDQYF